MAGADPFDLSILTPRTSWYMLNHDLDGLEDYLESWRERLPNHRAVTFATVRLNRLKLMLTADGEDRLQFRGATARQSLALINQALVDERYLSRRAQGTWRAIEGVLDVLRLDPDTASKVIDGIEQYYEVGGGDFL